MTTNPRDTTDFRFDWFYHFPLIYSPLVQRNSQSYLYLSNSRFSQPHVTECKQWIQDEARLSCDKYRESRLSQMSPEPQLQELLLEKFLKFKKHIKNFEFLIFFFVKSASLAVLSPPLYFKIG